MTRECGGLSESSPSTERWKTPAGQEWLRQDPLRAKSPSPIFPPAKNSLSHYRASDRAPPHEQALTRVYPWNTHTLLGMGHKGIG